MPDGADIGRAWYEDWSGEAFDGLDTESKRLWIERGMRVWRSVFEKGESLHYEAVVHEGRFRRILKERGRWRE